MFVLCKLQKQFEKWGIHRPNLSRSKRGGFIWSEVNISSVWNRRTDGCASEVVHFQGQIAHVGELVKMIQTYLHRFLPKWLSLTWQRCECYLVQINGTNCMAIHSFCSVSSRHDIVGYFAE